MSNPAGGPPTPEEDAGAARLVRQHDLATPDQIVQAMEVRRQGSDIPFTEILSELGHITEEQAAEIEKELRAASAGSSTEVVPLGSGADRGDAIDEEPADLLLDAGPTGASIAVVPAADEPEPPDPDPPPAAPARATPVAPLAVTPAKPARPRQVPTAAPAAPAAPAPAPAPAASAPAASAPAFKPHEGPRMLDAILAHAVKLGASDVHVHSGAPIQARHNGILYPGKMSILDPASAQKMVTEVLTPDQFKQLTDRGEVDFAYTMPGVGRFRANAYRQRRGWDAVFRILPREPPTLASLGLPSVLERLTSFHQGLVLVTGPAGCGKSATLAALVNLINETRTDHILTVEDPIEIVHPSKKCLVNQRQVVRHTETFASALRGALREDPDVIVIGELRDLETIALAITAAETGHLVMATLHTNNAIRTINRVLDVFPPNQQSQIRAMVSESLRAIVSQRLVPTADGRRRVPATEILFMSHASGNMIREEKTVQLKTVLQTGKSQGMCLLDDSLLELVKSSTITKETARRAAEDPRAFV